LVDRGIEASRIVARGRRASQPVANDQSEEDRRKDRRVDLTLVQ
jgi:outer membrane protein OmpA-like peptidoglycan-associated protein